MLFQLSKAKYRAKAQIQLPNLKRVFHNKVAGCPSDQGILAGISTKLLAELTPMPPLPFHTFQERIESGLDLLTADGLTPRALAIMTQVNPRFRTPRQQRTERASAMSRDLLPDFNSLTSTQK